MRGLRAALAFLTRLPGGAHPEGPAGLAGAVPWFPVVGALVGALVAVVHVPLAGPVPPLAAAAVAVGVSALLTGALHEDGFADTFDALAGGRDPEQRRRILADPRHGTFGVLGLVVLTVVKVSTLATLDGWGAVAALVAAGAAGRAAAVAVLAWAPAAGGSGLGAAYRQGLGRAGAVAGVVLGVAVAAVTLGPLAVPALALVGAGAVVVAGWARRRIGGANGDVLGAVEQVGECAVLLLAAAAVTPGGP